jgi:hypothetical protein
MSSNRLKYDVCSYKSDLKQSVKPMNHVMDPIRFENCNKCMHKVGIVGGTGVTHIKGNLVDLESSMFGITQPATKCPEYEWAPLEGNSIVSKEYLKCDKHSPIDVTLDRDLSMCDFTHSDISQAEEPPLDLYKCTR